MDEVHENEESFLASQGNSAEAFDFGKEELDLITLLVEAPVDRGRGGHGWDWPWICASCPEAISYEHA
ncbi:hypothetical protein FXF46_12405 [Gluconobacter thailandicus]|uniref:Uncharacterized protein n=1 Tax=Gluconobacter thailandicus TaxID=257438 RepID=A0AAP9ETA0_GLUTH|nr:hypothetical protein FXF46_12405 [Gluconobacter thailandicus]